jgi:hypothetical protein
VPASCVDHCHDHHAGAVVVTVDAIAPAWLKAKKADLAASAEREIARTGWLPVLLRRAA